MRLVLAAMPWQALHRPSLPVGLLHSLVRRDCADVDVTEYHGGLRWGEFLATGLPVTTVVEQLELISENGVLQGLGELIFSPSVYDTAPRIDHLTAIVVKSDADAEIARRMRDLVPEFLDTAVAEILGWAPDVVGLTSTFMQNVPSLALARRLKSERPDLQVVLGGANCEGPMGHALHRNHRYLDYVVRGEAEEIFPELLTRIARGTPVADLPGVCWWDGDRSVANVQAVHSVPPGRIPAPTFDGWHELLESSPLREYVTPELVVEGSRGCWWGEKHHCTFCGLNGALMAFRSKPAEQFWAELSALVERHQILDVSAVDNILDMAYFRDLLPRMTAADWDLRVHFEIKSNLRAEQIGALASAGIVIVQPGIESLNGRVLDLMDKGVSGAANVQTLRECEDNRLTVDWNYLYGFPGELRTDYLPVLDQMPALAHLQPPSGAARIVLERYSPYFERPELGFPRREPLGFYRQAYDLPAEELSDLAYFFDSDDTGIDSDSADALRGAIAEWRRRYPTSSLRIERDPSGVTIRDRRVDWPPRDHRLTGWQADGYDILGHRRSPRALLTRLRDLGYELEAADVDAWLASLRDDGLVFVDRDDWIALATTAVPAKVAGDGPGQITSDGPLDPARVPA